MLDVARRTSTFEEVQRGLTEFNAQFEARRCLSCGNCFECDNCYGVCPDNAIIKLGPGARFSSSTTTTARAAACVPPNAHAERSTWFPRRCDGLIGKASRTQGDEDGHAAAKGVPRADTALARVVSARHRAAARSDVEQGHRVQRLRTRDAGPARPVAAARIDAGRAGRARDGELSPPADAARQVHHAGVAAGPKRGAVLSRHSREPRRDDADHLHADGRPRVPAVRAHLSASAWAVRQRRRPREDAVRCCATGRIAKRRSSWSPMASAFSDSAISGRTEWGSRSASWRSTPRAPACIRAAACRSCWMSVPTTKRCSPIRCISVCDRKRLTGAAVRRAGRGVHRGDPGRVSRHPGAVRGLRQPQRVPPAAALPRSNLLVQRRHPGHRQRDGRGHLLGSARDAQEDG